MFGVFALAMIAIGIIFEIKSSEKQSRGNSSLTVSDEILPTVSPSFAPSSMLEVDLNNIISGLFGTDARSFQVGSDAWNGRKWILKNDPFMASSSHWSDLKMTIMLQKFVLATIAFAFSDKGGVSLPLDWMDIEECESQHIHCNGDGTIRSLVLGRSCNHHSSCFRFDSSSECSLYSMIKIKIILRTLVEGQYHRKLGF